MYIYICVCTHTQAEYIFTYVCFYISEIIDSNHTGIGGKNYLCVGKN